MDRLIEHYVVDDCDRRASTVAFFDGERWWLPGSELSHPRSSFEGSSYRFIVRRSVNTNSNAYGLWNPESGRFI